MFKFLLVLLLLPLAEPREAFCQPFRACPVTATAFALNGQGAGVRFDHNLAQFWVVGGLPFRLRFPYGKPEKFTARAVCLQLREATPGTSIVGARMKRRQAG